MNVQWLEIPFVLQSQYQGGLQINQVALTDTGIVWTPGPQWITDPSGCQAGSAKRVTRDNSPQSGGEIVHRHFKTGAVYQLKLVAVNILGASGEYEPACDTDLVNLSDDLARILDGMENTDGWLYWQPSGYESAICRCLYSARWLGPDGLGGAAFTAVLEARDTDVFVTTQFALLSQYPYALDLYNPTVPYPGFQPPSGYGDPVPTVLPPNTAIPPIDQYGSTDMWPVLHLYGPLAPGNTVTLTCTNVPDLGTFVFVYNTNLPLPPYPPGPTTLALANADEIGGSIEINMFTNTAYFNSNAGGTAGDPTTYVYNGANAKAGIDITQSDFWSLCANYPGGLNSNTVEMTTDDPDVTADIVWANAWV